MLTLVQDYKPLIWEFCHARVYFQPCHAVSWAYVSLARATLVECPVYLVKLGPSGHKPAGGSSGQKAFARVETWGNSQSSDEIMNQFFPVANYPPLQRKTIKPQV